MLFGDLISINRIVPIQRRIKANPDRIDLFDIFVMRMLKFYPVLRRNLTTSIENRAFNQGITRVKFIL